MMTDAYQLIEKMELGAICEVNDDLQSGKIRVARTREILDFHFSGRRRICQLGSRSRSRRSTQARNVGALIWVPMGDPLLRAIELPDSKIVTFERKFDSGHWSGRKMVVGPWAAYDDNLYVLTRANSVEYVIKDYRGQEIWAGLFSQQTGCRIDTKGVPLPNLFTCGSIEWDVSGMFVEVDFKKRRYSELFNARVIAPDHEAQRTKTGRRAM